MFFRNALGINAYYIGIIVEDGKTYSSSHVDIAGVSFAKELRAAYDNSNNNVIDLQNVFVSHFPENRFKRLCYSYIYPSEYSCTYVRGVKYPKLQSYEDYKKEILEYEEKVRKELITSEEANTQLEQIRKDSKEKYEKEIKDRNLEIKDKVNKYKDILKDNFYNVSRNFVFAYNYNKTLTSIKERFGNKLKLYTTEQIGWTDFAFKFNEDFEILIKTNFGYGMASYFLCLISYKDIKILPYSVSIKYYNVNWVDIIRYTRDFRVDRSSWEPVIDFVVDAANLASNNPSKFIDEWVINDIQEMVKGLHAIMDSPKVELEKLLNAKKRDTFGLDTLVTVVTWKDHYEYKIQPQEQIFAFKVEKITGSLFYLENLKQLCQYNSRIQQYIDDIIGLNKEIEPEIVGNINYVEYDLARLKALSSTLEKKNKETRKLLEPIEKKFEEESEKEKEKLQKDFSISEFSKRFEKENSTFHNLKIMLSEDMVKLKKTMNDLSYRENYLKRLSDCLERIKDKMKTA